MGEHSKWQAFLLKHWPYWTPLGLIADGPRREPEDGGEGALGVGESGADREWMVIFRVRQLFDLAQSLGFDLRAARVVDDAGAGGGGKHLVGVDEGDLENHALELCLVAGNARLHGLTLAQLREWQDRAAEEAESTPSEPPGQAP